MKTEIVNLIEINKLDLIKSFDKINPSKNEHFKENDLVVIKQYGDTITLAKISKASFLVRKHLDITENPQIYRKK